MELNDKPCTDDMAQIQSHIATKHKQSICLLGIYSWIHNFAVPVALRGTGT